MQETLTRKIANTDTVFAELGGDFLRDSDFKSCRVNQTVTFACSSTTQLIIKMQIQTEISQSNTNSAKSNL